MKTSWTFFEFPYRRQSTHAHALTRSRYFYLHMLVRDTHGINLALPPNPRYCHRQMLVHDMMVSPTYLAPPPRPAAPLLIVTCKCLCMRSDGTSIP